MKQTTKTHCPTQCRTFNTHTYDTPNLLMESVYHKPRCGVSLSVKMLSKVFQKTRLRTGTNHKAAAQHSDVAYRLPLT